MLLNCRIYYREQLFTISALISTSHWTQSYYDGYNPCVWMCHAVGIFLPSTNDSTSHQSQIVKNEYLVSDFTIYFLMEVLMKCRYDHLFVPWYLQFLLFSEWNHILSFITYCLIFKEYLWRWRLQCQWLCLGIAWIPFAKTAAPVPVK